MLIALDLSIRSAKSMPQDQILVFVRSCCETLMADHQVLHLLYRYRYRRFSLTASQQGVDKRSPALLMHKERVTSMQMQLLLI
jgi:hypothetical protein